MKKLILTLVFAASFSSLSAQTETEKKENNTDFNQWSVELDGGFNKPQRPMGAGAYTEIVSPYVVNLGARYMFNNKFGLKADFGYNSFQEETGSVDFDTKLYRVAVQGVINAGRVLNFEDWTNTIGLLFHAGVGVAQLEDQNSAGKDKIGNFIGGVTGQIRLSDRFALTGDFTTIVTAKQDLNFDGSNFNGTSGLQGFLFTGTAGLTYYLGKNTKHADWVVINVTDELENKLAALEAKLTQDTDNDGVADFKDEEPNSAPGAVVNTKGKTIVVKDAQGTVVKTESDLKTLINGGYVGVYYDFNKSTPTGDSTGNIDFILTYLRNNPSANVEITGYADEIGSTSYNNTLSNARANNVKETLVKANIDASRLTIVGAGEDTSVSKDSDAARSLVRKVTFKIK
ncbi:OmpA-OmpF porin, OOP family [Flavobacterium fluvii]|uniref:OmpA-OmpF porin, OOP family n=1 Tax=Flavobacterium fluvii TaxID=468056 RepID=A0A1M5F8L9_9FLAO|nr:OmpA family protein [Flavobacterium fluvii]SHF87933.1 OmpA-OmpF porin, OOP family [Flavobacterium fluvii]